MRGSSFLLFFAVIVVKATEEEVYMTHPTSEKLIARYIDLSINLTVLFKDTDIEEENIHELAKKVISNEENPDKVQQIYHKFAESLPEDQRKVFNERFLDRTHTSFMHDRVQTIMGYYLTKDQIQRLRTLLETKAAEGATKEQMIDAMHEEITKDIGKDRATKALELTMKNLRMFGKKHGEDLKKVEKHFHHIIHDEM